MVGGWDGSAGGCLFDYTPLAGHAEVPSTTALSLEPDRVFSFVIWPCSSMLSAWRPTILKLARIIAGCEGKNQYLLQQPSPATWSSLFSLVAVAAVNLSAIELTAQCSSDPSSRRHSKASGPRKNYIPSAPIPRAVGRLRSPFGSTTRWRSTYRRNLDHHPLRMTISGIAMTISSVPQAEGCSARGAGGGTILRPWPIASHRVR